MKWTETVGKISALLLTVAFITRMPKSKNWKPSTGLCRNK